MCLSVSFSLCVWNSESIHWTNEQNNYKYYKANQYNCICWIKYQLWWRAYIHAHENKCHYARAFVVFIFYCNLIALTEHHSQFNASIIISVKLILLHRFCCVFFLLRSIEMQNYRRYHYHHEYNMHSIKCLRLF